MDDTTFDRALIDEAFAVIAEQGFQATSVAAAAKRSGLPLDRARARFPDMGRVLMRFGSLADQAALSDLDHTGSTRDALFGLIMRRIDFLQTHRAGVVALLRGLPADPLLAVLLSAATLRSMAWMLEAAGLSSSGFFGLMRAKGLMAVWLWTVRAWRRDDSADLSATMVALDTALSRAEQAAGWLHRDAGRSAPGSAEPDVAEPATPVDVVPEGAVSEDGAPEETLPPAAPFAPPDAPASPPT